MTRAGAVFFGFQPPPEMRRLTGKGGILYDFDFEPEVPDGFAGHTNQRINKNHDPWILGMRPIFCMESSYNNNDPLSLQVARWSKCPGVQGLAASRGARRAPSIPWVGGGVGVSCQFAGVQCFIEVHP